MALKSSSFLEIATLNLLPQIKVKKYFAHEAI